MDRRIIEVRATVSSSLADEINALSKLPNLKKYGLARYCVLSIEHIAPIHAMLALVTVRIALADKPTKKSKGKKKGS